MKKRFLSLLMTAAMLLTLVPAEVFASEMPTNPAEDAPVCICTGKCTEDSINGECPVCSAEGADLAACTGEETTPAVDAPQCTCVEKCTANSTNEECPVCSAEGADLSACAGVGTTPAVDAPQCTCVEKCTADSINEDCPVCSAEGADLAACAGEETDPDALDPELLTLLEEAGFTSEDYFWALDADQSALSLMDQAKYLDIMELLNAGISLLAIGSESTPFYISNASQLKELADYVNAGNTTFNAAHYEMTADIDLSAYRADTGWTPIGSWEHPFAGVFDGGSHIITGLKIDNSSENDQGLFGVVNGASDEAPAQIKNVVVKDADIKGKSNVGAVVGYYGDGQSNARHIESLENCAMLGGSVSSGETNVGGVVGQASGTVTNCYATGSASGTSNTGSNVGGVVGQVCAGGNVNSCYATGSISGIGQNVGGVVGEVDGAVSNCYATGNISGDTYVGGVVGQVYADGNVSNCVALNLSVNASGSDAGRVAGAGAVNNCYAWSGMTVTKNGVPVSATADKDTLYGADLTCNNGTITPSFAAIFTENNSAWENILAADKLPTLSGVGGVQDSTLPPWITAASENTVYITSAAELKALAEGVNGGTIDTTDKTYVLTKDIDLSAYQAGAGWTPIGTSEHSFKGTFDGGNHTITGLKIDNSNNYQGLFGYVDTLGTLKNIVVKNADITGQDGVGAIAGASKGKVENCAMVGGSICGVSLIGGVVGYTIGTSEVSNCYATGSVRGGSSVGGVVGDASGAVTNCYATGSVIGGSSVGGVVGNASDNVSNCYATGSVRGTGSNVGGVVGNASDDVSNCYATGSVSSTGSSVGGIVGKRGTGTVKNCVALNPSVSGNGSNGRVTCLFSGEINYNYAWSGMKVNDSVVQEGKGPATIHGEDLTYVGGTLNRQFSVIFTANNAAWTYTENGLPTLKNVGGTQESTLPAHITGVYFEGEGTSQSPYLIKTAFDLHNLAELVNASNTTYYDKCYKLNNDIDLSAYQADEGWTPIGTGTSPFAGVFDGNGKTITGLHIDFTTVY